jgi:membrane fusion protein, multidrug efflux system
VHGRHTITLLLICLPLASCARVSVKASVEQPEGVPVRTALVTEQDVPLEVSAVGNVEAINSVEVRPRIAGVVSQVAFHEGENVTKGQLLFAIDPDTVERQAAEQRAELERDTALEDQARAVIARDAASQKQSQAEADVAVALVKDGILSQQRTDQLVTASETARAALHSDQAALEAAAGTAKADRARLQQTQLQLIFTKVTAPISGRAGAVLVKAGNIVRDNDTTLVTLLQLSPVNVSFGVPEQVLAEVQRLNAQGALTVEASIAGSSLQGHLVFIDNTVDATTGSIRLKAIFPNADNALWPGEFVNVRLRLRMEKGRLVVPAAAVQDGLDGKYVWLVQSGIATTAPVNLLRTYKPANGPEQAILEDGIHPGNTVVTEGQLRLTPNARVSQLDPPAAQPSHSSSNNTITAP